MPKLNPAPCRHGGCNRLATAAGRCDLHQADRQRRARHAPESAARRGYDATWRKLRKVKLAANPLCEEHEARGELVAATVVDHVIPHRGDPALLYDLANLRALCKSCHDRKTAAHDGGFGNPRRQSAAG